ILVVGALVCWSMWQPLRAVQADDAAVVALDERRVEAALSDAQAAVNANPLAVEPLFTLAAVEQARGRRDLARRDLEKAVRLQPSNPESWRRLAGFIATAENRPRDALPAARAALFLDPRSPNAQGLFLLARRGGTGRPPDQSKTPGRGTAPPTATAPGTSTTPPSTATTPPRTSTAAPGGGSAPGAGATP
ncbi:MAG TPA: tetratricopeptide repeat protein, partial [Solirubrobacteraceae bacterium]|nr:tetratricopeptide repeat protein [Solirubrobacteraceae bacterium]